MNEKLLLGTYTRGNSQGIYSIELNKDEKQLENLQLEAKVGSPTYLDTSFKGDVVYSIITGENEGGVGSFKYNEDGSFTQLDTALAEGKAPCYIAFDEKRNFVYSANYHQGEVSVYATNREGTLELKDTVSHSGNSVHENQDSPHAHYLDLTPDEKYLVSCDLGTDEVITYQVNEEGKLSEVAKLNVKPGTGPRHITFHPNAKYAYLFGELSCEILVLEYNMQDGTFKQVQTISTLPEDFNGENSGAAIRVTKDGQYLYASNRGHNSIVSYKIDENGQLEVLDFTPTKGDFPRDFNLNPDDQFLVVGHQHTDYLTLFERDEKTGKLTLLQSGVEAPEVVGIKFI